jgi:hypothetical protein
MIATGTQRPYMVVDDTGRSFDLVRQIEKVKTKEVRQRLKDEDVLTEKQAIKIVRRKLSEKNLDSLQEKMLDKIDRFKSEQEAKLEQRELFKNKLKAFSDTGLEMTAPKQMDEQETLRKKLLETLNRKWDKGKSRDR